MEILIEALIALKNNKDIVYNVGDLDLESPIFSDSDRAKINNCVDSFGKNIELKKYLKRS